jgi:solute carrier family 25 ornithine transporter 2/15
MLRNEGIAAFWKGAVPTAGGMILENCMAFSVNEALKRAFPDSTDGSAQVGPPSLMKPFLMVCRISFHSLFPYSFSSIENLLG